jgi:hypothetical protein
MAFLHGIETIEISDGIRPITAARSGVIGLIGTAPDADADIFPLNTPVLLAGTPRLAASLDTTGDGEGTLKDAVDAIYDQAGASVVVVRVDEGVDADATRAAVIGDATLNTGVHAFLGAETAVKVTPRILIAPGFTSDRPEGAANPVVAELLVIAARLRAVVIADGPNTNDADAITYAEDFGSDRLFIVDPHVKVFDTVAQANVIQPASGRVAGLIAKSDSERGFWFSPSNQVIAGIVGVARPIDFQMSNAASASNLLNEGKVATIIQRDGFRLWGNRTVASDALWVFLSVRRTADMIYEALEQSFLWAMDKPFSAQLILDIQDSVSAYLRQLKALGAIINGKVWLDPELNTQATLLAGQLYVDLDIEPPAPLERLSFRVHRNGTYYEELVEQVIQAA